MLVINNSLYNKFFIVNNRLISETSNDELNDLCPNSCTEISYERMTKSILHDLSDMSLISTYYQSDLYGCWKNILCLTLVQFWSQLEDHWDFSRDFHFSNVPLDFVQKLLPLPEDCLRKNIAINLKLSRSAKSVLVPLSSCM